jgi:hypothetical protein
MATCRHHFVIFLSKSECKLCHLKRDILSTFRADNSSHDFSGRVATEEIRELENYLTPASSRKVKNNT